MPPFAGDIALWTCSDLCFLAVINALCVQIIICDQHMFKRTLKQAMEAPGYMHTQVRSAVNSRMPTNVYLRESHTIIDVSGTQKLNPELDV